MLEKYHSKDIITIDKFSKVVVKFVPRVENEKANKMAQAAFDWKIPIEVYSRIISMEKISKLSILEDDELVLVLPIQVDDDD